MKMLGSSVRSVPRAALRVVAAGLAYVTIIVGISSCSLLHSDHATQATRTPKPLAGLSASKIFTRAVADMGRARSVHIRGVVSQPHIRLDLRLLQSKGCVGTMAKTGHGAFSLIVIGTTVWVKPDRKFLHSIGAPPAALRKMSGKYLKSTAAGKFRPLVRLCRLRVWARLLRKVNVAQWGGITRTTLAGRPAIMLIGTGKTGRIYVSSASEPQLLRISHRTKAGGILTFSGYG